MAFGYDNLTERLLTVPGMDFSQPIHLELLALDIHANPPSFVPVHNSVIPRLENTAPVAANDSFQLPLATTQWLNLIAKRFGRGWPGPDAGHFEPAPNTAR